jgi:SAM-dependent methyltransferase
MFGVNTVRLRDTNGDINHKDFVQSPSCRVVSAAGETSFSSLAAPGQDVPSLPVGLDKFIFSPTGSLKGRYLPRSLDVSYNLDADQEHNRIYLGTYFPRSFAESQDIFSKLISPDLFSSSFGQKSLLHVLDIGSGTGGNLCGLLLALQAQGYRGRVVVTSVDGNARAMDSQEKIIRFFRQQGLSLSVTFKKMVFSGQQEVFEDQLRNVMGTDHDYDIIMAWKTISEYYKHTPATGCHMLYAGFLNAVADRLTPKGVCVLLDVCTRGMNMGPWIPVRMANEVRHYIQDADSCLGIVSPVSCALWGDRCTAQNCFKQRIFFVSHSQKTYDRSKVCYYVFARKPYARSFIKAEMVHDAYGISPASEGKVCTQGSLMENVGVDYATYPDAFMY